MTITRFFKPRIWLVLIGGALLSIEVLVRATGMVDFPMYEANAQIGYIPAASQQGNFLNKNKWEFNSLHMGASEFKPGPGPNVLLIGDSLVYGGNSYRQQDRLGPSLQTLMQGTGGGEYLAYFRRQLGATQRTGVFAFTPASAGAGRSGGVRTEQR